MNNPRNRWNDFTNSFYHQLGGKLILILFEQLLFKKSWRKNTSISILQRDDDTKSKTNFNTEAKKMTNQPPNEHRWKDPKRNHSYQNPTILEGMTYHSSVCIILWIRVGVDQHPELNYVSQHTKQKTNQIIVYCQWMLSKHWNMSTSIYDDNSQKKSRGNGHISID